MKITPATTSLLQSFSNISANLLVKPGSKLATRNAVNSVQARAVVEEVFPVEFAIYDLNQLLALLSASGDADIEFGERSLTITSAAGRTQYYYADPSLIAAPSDNEPKLETHYTFSLTSAEISTIQKIAGIVSATMLSIVSKNGKATLCINDPKNSSSNNFSQDLGACDLDFDVRMGIDNFKVVADSYDVQIAHAVGKSGAKALVFFLSSTTRGLTYLIAADTTSKL